jgi:iron complex outermembrane receptor protein
MFAQVQNLTNERSATISVPDEPDTWLKYQTYGRRFLLGATYKFGQHESAPPPPPPPLPPPPPPPPQAPATQTCANGTVILATDACPAPPPPPEPTPERGS